MDVSYIVGPDTWIVIVGTDFGCITAGLDSFMYDSRARHKDES